MLCRLSHFEIFCCLPWHCSVLNKVTFWWTTNSISPQCIHNLTLDCFIWGCLAKRKYFKNSFSGMEQKFFFKENANSVWLNNQAFLMQYVMANILWLKLRYIGYIQVAPFHLFWLNFLFLTWLCHHHHHLHHHNDHDDQEKHNIMYKKSRANGSQAGGLPDCTEVTDWPSTRTTIEISLILHSHSHLRKE